MQNLTEKQIEKVAPSRVRELKLKTLRPFVHIIVAPSRVRELKPKIHMDKRRRNRVAPSRVRELKPQKVLRRVQKFPRRTLTGA